MAEKLSPRGAQGITGGSLRCTQLALNFGDFVFLEQADAGDSGGARFRAGVRICNRDSAQREDWNFFLTGLLQECEARGCHGSLFLFEDRSEDSEAGAVGGGLADLSRRMTRNSNHTMTLLPDPPNLLRRHILGTEMDSISTNG